jgi:hypothetical protein
MRGFKFTVCHTHKGKQLFCVLLIKTSAMQCQRLHTTDLLCGIKNYGFSDNSAS